MDTPHPGPLQHAFAEDPLHSNARRGKEKTNEKNKQVKQKYIEISKKEKYYEKRSENLTNFLINTVGIQLDNDDQKTTVIKVEDLINGSI